MHDNHDLDLIADHADGIPSPDAERLLESCAECRAELAMHLEMKELLASAPVVTMTDDERAQLHAGVRAGIEQPAPVVSITERRQRLWMRLGSVAAAMFVTVGVAGVFANMEDGGVETAAFEAASDTTAGGESAAREDVQEESAAFAADAATETTAAASEDTTASGEGGGAEQPEIPEAIPVGPLVDAGAITFAELEERVTATIELLRTDPAPLVLDTDWFNGNSERPAPSCLSSEVDPVFSVINAVIDGQETQTFVVLDAATGDYRADTFLAEDCSLIE